MKKTWLLWLSALIITLFAAYYQRITGPSYAVKCKIKIRENSYNLIFPRSNEGKLNTNIWLDIPDTSVHAKVFYRYYMTNQFYIPIDFKREAHNLISKLPNAHAGVKFEYYIELKYDNVIMELKKENPIILRCRDYVPGFILIPHIILMFLAMMFSNLTGLIVYSGKGNIKYYSIITFVILFLGGIIFGCLVQKFAFGKYWTGIPFGWDLTDNKTLIALISWAIAIIFNQTKERNYLYFFASIIMLLIFSIPHSMFGTEFKIVNN